MDEQEVKIKQEIYAGSTAVPDLPPKVVRIFVSSTFVDAEAERNVLLNEVHSTVWWWCKHHDLDFQLVDMRWGVRDEASSDHTTVQICLREIQKCQNMSMGPNFLFLLGQRYGYRPIPATIDAAKYDLLSRHFSDIDDDAGLLSAWYLRDDNAVPPVYVLQPLLETVRGEWALISERLLRILRAAAAEAEKVGEITAQEKHMFFMSVTEREIREALESSNASNHCIGVTRTITDLEQHLGQTNAKKFCDIHSNNKIREEEKTLLTDLRQNYVPNHLDGSNTHHFDVKWSSKGVDPACKDHRAYLDQFSTAVTNNTIALIKSAQARFTHYALSKDELFLEVARHAEFCRNKCINFQGCNDIISAIFAKIRDNTFTKPVVIHGPSGSGKTSIMAMVQQNAQRTLGFPCVVVSRFLGTTSQSSTIINVILSIAQQICAAYSIPDNTESIKRRPKELFPYFHSLLRQVSATPDRHLLILFDSLDQLESVYGAHRCLWLPRYLPPNVDIVVSTLPDMHGILPKLQQLLGNPDCFLPVAPLPERTGNEIMQSWMRSIGRSVAEDQENIVKRAFLKCPQPLYLKLLFEEARRWKSYTPVDEGDLAITIRAAIWKLFERLERQFGQRLVSHALGYIIAARSGLTHSELEDILSLDDEVLDEIYQYWSPVDLSTVRIPSLLWTRLKYELEEYLVERQADGRAVMVLYHRQFTEAAQARYLNDPQTAKKRYQVLADFFEARWYDKPKTLVLTQRKHTLQANRKVTSQPLRFDKEFNQRKISELPYCLLFAEEISRLVENTFGNFEFVLTSMKAHSTQYVIEELSWMLNHHGILGSDVHTQLGLLQDTLRLAKPTLEFKNNTQAAAVELLGRLTHFEHQFPNLIGRLVAGCRRWCEEVSQALLIPTLSCFPTPGGPMRTTLIGHAGNILHLCISEDGKYLATSDQEGAVYIWELGPDELMHSLKDPAGGKQVDHVTISPDNKWIVGWIMESGVIQVWNMQSGDPASRMVITGDAQDSNRRIEHRAHIILPQDSKTIFCGVSDQLKAYNIHSGESLREARISSGSVSSLHLSNDDRYIHVVTQEGGYTTLDPTTLDTVSDLSPHEGQVTCFTSTETGRVGMGFTDGHFCLVCADENENSKWIVGFNEEVPNKEPVACMCIKEDMNILIVAANNEIYVWDYNIKELKFTLSGHEEGVQKVEVAAGNHFLVSGGKDDVIMVWHLTAGTRVQVLDGQQADISLLIRHHNFLASASFGSPYIKLWDVSPKFLSQQHQKFVDRQGVATITQDLRHVVHQEFVSEPKVSVWDTKLGMGYPVEVTDNKNSQITCFTVTNSGRIAVVGCDDGNIITVNLSMRKVVNVHQSIKSKVVSMSVRADDRFVAVAHANNTVNTVNLQTLRSQRQYQADVKGNVSHVCLTQKDGLVIATDAGLVYAMLSQAGQLVKLEGNQSGVNCLDISPDERHVACGMDEASTLVWDLQMTRVDLQIKAKSVTHLCFTKDNQYLATTGSDKKIRLWRRSNGILLRDIYIYANLSCLKATEGALIGTTVLGQVVALEIKDRKQVLKRQVSKTCAIL